MNHDDVAGPHPERTHGSRDVVRRTWVDLHLPSLHRAPPKTPVDSRRRTHKPELAVRRTVRRTGSGRNGMAFVQIIEFKTSKMDEMRKLGEEWEAAAGSDSTARRRVMGEDRDHPGQYVNIVFFDSYDEAMKNSNLPVTQEFSKKMMELGDGPPNFTNVDVIEDRTS
jgi:hypothetical protein